MSDVRVFIPKDDGTIRVLPVDDETPGTPSTIRSAIVNRDLSAVEANNAEPIKSGTRLFVCLKNDYGCCSWDETAMTFDPTGDYPFMGIPSDALDWE